MIKSGYGADVRGGSVMRHWLRGVLAVLVALFVTALLGVFVNFVVSLLAGIVLAGVTIGVITQTGYRSARGADNPADAILGIGLMIAAVSLAYFAPFFYLSAFGEEGVTDSVFRVHSSRGGSYCEAGLPSGKTARVSCLDAGDANRLSDYHYRVVYDPHGNTSSVSVGRKSDLPVVLGAGFVVGGLVVSGVGAGLGIRRLRASA